jgi:16S rRNA (guanine527-N7)-methyltransferase
MSKNDEGRIVLRHFAESLAPAKWLMESGAASWLDFGSGAGFPAIPLAIAGVGSSWTLVESRRSKTLFLRKSIQDLVLVGMQVVNTRLETLEPMPEKVDGFTARATESLAKTLAMASALVRPGGNAFLWKGSKWLAELEADPDWRSSWSMNEAMPIADNQATVIRFTRHSI